MNVFNRMQLDSLRKHLRAIDSGSAIADKMKPVDFAKWHSTIANKAFVDQVQVTAHGRRKTYLVIQNIFKKILHPKLS
jgi:hypothetical protein